MTDIKRYTQEELDWLRVHYADMGPDLCANHLTRHSRKSISTKATCMGLLMTREAKRRLRAYAAKIGRERKAAKQAPVEVRTGPPDEYVKVSSIFRVGDRYAAQVSA